MAKKAAKTREISYLDATNYLAGLNQLNVYNRVMKSGDSEQVVKVPFSFSAEAMIAIVINTNRLTVVQKDLQDATAKLMRSITGGTDFISPPTLLTRDATPEQRADHAAALEVYRDHFARFQDGLKTLHETKVEVELRSIPSSGLRLDQNPVAAAALVAMEPLIEWQDEAAL